MPGSPPDSGLATPTKFQNCLRMKFSNRLEFSYVSDEGSANEEGDEATGDMNEERFAEGVAQLAQTIEDLSRAIRFDHLQKSDSKSAKLEAARREKEAELRRARKKEQMAKDPTRKVAFKLDRRRREQQEMAEAMAKVSTAEMPRRKSKDIPLVPFHSEGCGSGNKEPVSIVDVKKIQRSCEGLGHHQNASEMLEVRRHRKEPKSHQPSLRQTSWFPSSLLDGLSVEERLAKVKAQRDNLTAQKMRRKLQIMRTECPAYLFRAWGMGDDFDFDSDSESEMFSSRASQASIRRASFNSRCSEDNMVHRKSKRFTTRMTNTNSLSPAALLKARRSTARHTEDRQRLAGLAAARGKKLRTVRRKMQACVQWLKILFRRRRRDLSADICLVLLKQLGEWVRIRGALKQFINNVKIIQRTIREYLALKRRRCHIIEREWCRIEDLHLSTFARARAATAMQETDTGKVKTKRRVLQAALEATVSSKWKLLVDFTSYRIPVAERRAIISTYYKKAIKRHMYIGKTFLQLVLDALRAGRELDNFLNQFHYENDRKSAVESFQIKKEDLITDHRQDSSEALFWQMTEATIVKLIACCAQVLAKLDVYKDHPANQAIPDDKRSAWEDYVIGSDPYEFAEFILMKIDRPVYRGRFARNPSMREENILREEAKKNARGGKSRGTLTGSKQEQIVDDDDEEVPRREVENVEEALNSFSPWEPLPIHKDRRFRSLCSTMTLASLCSDLEHEAWQGESLQPSQDFSSTNGTDFLDASLSP